MNDLFEELAGFLMQEEEANIYEEVVTADSLLQNHHSSTLTSSAGLETDNNAAAPIMGMVSSFEYDVNYERDEDLYNHQSDRHLFDCLHNQSGGLIYGSNHPSDEILPDNLLLDVTDNFQANCSIDQYYDLIDTSKLQQQAADVCYDRHQTQSPSPFLIDNVFIDAGDDKIPDSRPSTAPELKQPEDQGPHGQEQGPQEHGQQQSQLPVIVTGDIQEAKKRKRQQKQQVVLADHVADEENEEEEDVDLIPNEGCEDDDDIGNDDQSSPVISKNLMSERKRRKRLNQQLFTLRSIVPNITKMDKRSVLVDALAHLQNMLRQTEIEIENQNNIDSSTAVNDHGDAMVDYSLSPNSTVKNVKINLIPCHDRGVVHLEKNVVVDVNVDDDQLQTLLIEPPVISLPSARAIFPAIIKIEADKVDEERYLMKIVYNKALGAMGQVQRSVEMLKGVDFINVSISEYDQHHMQSSYFLRVKRVKAYLQVTDEDNLLNRLIGTAKQLGLLLPSEASSSK